jgi:hypothetical protein
MTIHAYSKPGLLVRTFVVRIKNQFADSDPGSGAFFDPWIRDTESY